MFFCFHDSSDWEKAWREKERKNEHGPWRKNEILLLVHQLIHQARPTHILKCTAQAKSRAYLDRLFILDYCVHLLFTIDTSDPQI